MEEKQEKTLVNPLRNEVVTVRLVPKMGSITDKRHVLYGGMAETSKLTLTVPVVESTGSYKNVLTNEEKAFFEKELGINLSVHNKVDNYWDNYQVTLNKNDNYLDLSNPDDYIKYKVLLANKNLVCPSLREYNERPLATYRFVIVTNGVELEMATDKRKTKVECYKLAGKIEKDYDTLKTVVEMLDKRPLADDVTITFLANRLDELIDSSYREVYKVLTDPMLPTQVLVKKGVSEGIIAKMGDFYYLKSGKEKTPLCEEGKDPTLKNAVAFLNNPKNQEVKFSLEAQVNK